MVKESFQSYITDHPRNKRVKAIRTAGSTAEKWATTLLIELKARIL